MFGIALGYPDANDATRLAHDPIHKLMIGRDPVEGERLASQPTISRMENGVGRADLLDMGKEMAEGLRLDRALIEQQEPRSKSSARRFTKPRPAGLTSLVSSSKPSSWFTPVERRRTICASS